ncbi:MAG TPA: GNAT family N-acetyltransferase [Allosphingosinicella sp.]|jgi:putative acetyltransferase
MQIRRFRSEDAPALARLYHEAVHRVGAVHYTPEQVRAWSPAVPDEAGFRARGGDGRLLLVAVDGEGEPLAYGDVEADGHIGHLYCRPDVAGSGITAALYDRLEAEARRQGIERLYVEASEPARRFFTRRGFSVLHRRDFQLRGVAIHNYAMEKRLV